MRKPSIFSRDYERQMRKRRRRITIISILGIFVIGILFFKVAINSINMETLRTKVQNWIDEDNENIQDPTSDPNEEIIDGNEGTIEEEEEAEELENKVMELAVNDAVIIKAGYEEVNGKLKFTEIKEVPDNIYYAINPNKSLVLTIDENQDMKIFNVNKNVSNVNTDKYVAPNGEVFNKNTVLKIYDNYLWNIEAKFIDNTTVAYISNVPYFGYNLSKYIWIVNLNDNSHKTLWNSKGNEIKFGEIKEKGLEVTIDGNVKYVNTNGQLTN